VKKKQCPFYKDDCLREECQMWQEKTYYDLMLYQAGCGLTTKETRMKDKGDE
jgi:hypothetical protein